MAGPQRRRGLGDPRVRGVVLSSLDRDVHRPNRLIALSWAGVVVLAGGVASLGIGLLTVV